MGGGKMPCMRVAKGRIMLKGRGGGVLAREEGEGDTGGSEVENGLLLYWGWNSSEIWLRTDSVWLTCHPWARFRLPGLGWVGVSWRRKDEATALSAAGAAAPEGAAWGPRGP